MLGQVSQWDGSKIIQTQRLTPDSANQELGGFLNLVSDLTVEVSLDQATYRHEPGKKPRGWLGRAFPPAEQIQPQSPSQGLPKPLAPLSCVSHSTFYKVKTEFFSELLCVQVHLTVFPTGMCVSRASLGIYGFQETHIPGS